MPSDNHISYIGTRFAWGGEEFFGIQAEDRRRHLYTIGKTGTGKTTLLRNLIVQDIEAGRGVGVIDPHGGLAQTRGLPRVKDVCPLRTNPCVCEPVVSRERRGRFLASAASMTNEMLPREP